METKSAKTGIIGQAALVSKMRGSWTHQFLIQADQKEKAFPELKIRDSHKSISVRGFAVPVESAIFA